NNFTNPPNSCPARLPSTRCPCPIKIFDVAPRIPLPVQSWPWRALSEPHNILGPSQPPVSTLCLLHVVLGWRLFLPEMSLLLRVPRRSTGKSRILMRH